MGVGVGVGVGAGGFGQEGRAGVGVGVDRVLITGAGEARQVMTRATQSSLQMHL